MQEGFVLEPFLFNFFQSCIIDHFHITLGHEDGVHMENSLTSGGSKVAQKQILVEFMNSGEQISAILKHTQESMLHALNIII